MSTDVDAPENPDRDSSAVQAEADLYSDVALYVEDSLMGSAWVDVPEELEDLRSAPR